MADMSEYVNENELEGLSSVCAGTTADVDSPQWIQRRAEAQGGNQKVRAS
jgi:hypothetical protein